MKIAILHYTSWPEIGGVENVLRDQATMLYRAGHEVTVIAGEGRPSDTGIPHLLLPELSRDFPLNLAVRSVLERGQADQNFNTYRGQLMEVLDPVFSVMDLIIVHNVFTTHFNLPLTRALHDLATKHPIIAWTHDLTATNTDYALPNPTKAPWSLMRTSAPNVTYVATSQLRMHELLKHLQPAISAQVIPNPVDPGRLFGFTPEMRESLPSLSLMERDFIFLLPTRLMLRKNLEMAMEVIRQICEMGRNPLLLITGSKDTYSQAAEQYGSFLRQSVPAEMEAHIVFVSDFFPVLDTTMRDLYSLADCLLFPSRQEGFGLPLVEAALHRLPVWCGDIPAYRLLGSDNTFLFDNITKLPEAISWLENLSSFKAQRKARQLFDPALIYQQNYAPLLAPLATRVAH